MGTVDEGAELVGVIIPGCGNDCTEFKGGGVQKGDHVLHSIGKC